MEVVTCERAIPNHSSYIYLSVYPVHNVSYPFRHSLVGLSDLLEV